MSFTSARGCVCYYIIPILNKRLKQKPISNIMDNDIKSVIMCITNIEIKNKKNDFVSNVNLIKHANCQYHQIPFEA